VVPAAKHQTAQGSLGPVVVQRHCGVLGRTSGLVIQAMRSLGAKHVTPELTGAKATLRFGEQGEGRTTGDGHRPSRPLGFPRPGAGRWRLSVEAPGSAVRVQYLAGRHRRTFRIFSRQGAGTQQQRDGESEQAVNEVVALYGYQIL